MENTVDTANGVREAMLVMILTVLSLALLSRVFRTGTTFFRSATF